MLVLGLTFISLFHVGFSANILGLMGCASHSHHLWNEVIVNALADRGHTLTVASVDENKSPHPNVTYIHLEEAYNTVAEYYKDSGARFGVYGPFANIRLYSNFKILSCKGIFKSMGFNEASNLRKKFDLIVFDISAGQCMMRLIQKYPNIPTVGVSAFKMDPFIVDILGGHRFPGYVPYFLEHRDVPMNLWIRITNSAAYIFAHFYRKIITEPAIEGFAKQYVPGKKPTLESLYERVKIALINTHPAMDYTQSLPPNVIEVGGLHIKDPRNLPKDIQTFIETSEAGAIVISLGSNTIVETIGKKRIEAILSVVKSFPKYNFLWKVENDKIFKDVPKNLMTQKWLPQSDILAHPKTKAFFTHAGGLGMQEATWNGVPVIEMPLFLDQFSNAHRARSKGCGIEVDFENLTYQTLLEAFTKVLNDKSYENRMKEVQRKFRDRQNRPLDTAIWWIEYFLRNPSAEHLSPAARKTSFIVANSIDVYFTICAISLVFVVSSWIVLKNLKALFFESKKKDVKLTKIKKN